MQMAVPCRMHFASASCLPPRMPLHNAYAAACLVCDYSSLPYEKLLPVQGATPPNSLDSGVWRRSYDPATRGCTLFNRGAAVIAASADMLSGALPDMAECVGESWDACTITRNAELFGQELPQSGPMELGHPGKCCQLCKQTDGCTAW